MRALAVSASDISPKPRLPSGTIGNGSFANRVTSISGLSRVLNLSSQELLASEALGKQLPLSITPYYLSLLDQDNPDDPLRRAVVPNIAETTLHAGEADDPLGEEKHMVAPGLVHRYPDRVLFLATGFCSTYCRYCTRSRLVGDHGGGHCYSRANLQKALEYIEKNAHRARRAHLRRRPLHHERRTP